MIKIGPCLEGTHSLVMEAGSEQVKYSVINAMSNSSQIRWPQGGGMWLGSGGEKARVFVFKKSILVKSDSLKKINTSLMNE